MTSPLALRRYPFQRMPVVGTGPGHAARVFGRSGATPMIVAKEPGRSEGHVVARDRRVIRLHNRGAIVGPGHRATRVRCDDGSKCGDSGVPSRRERRRVVAARMRQLKKGCPGLARPKRDGELRLLTEGDDRLKGRSLRHIIESVPPRAMERIVEDGFALRRVRRKERQYIGVEAEIGARQSKLGEEPLNALAGIADEGAPGTRSVAPGSEAMQRIRAKPSRRPR